MAKQSTIVVICIVCILSPVTLAAGTTTAVSASETPPLVSDQRSGELGGNASAAKSTQSPIQDAINAATESETVRIPAGTYTEPITVDKNISLIGGPDVVLAGTSASDSAAGITIQGAAEPTISGFEIRNFTTGIQARSTHGAWHVTNTTVRNTTTGINALRTTGDWRVEGTEIVKSGRDDFSTQAGVNAEFSAGAWTIDQTTITQARYGVYAPTSSGNWSISRANISRTDLYAVTAEEASGQWSISTSILTQNHLSYRRIDRSVNGFDSTVAGDARGNWWGEDGYSENDCVGTVVCTNPLQTKPDAGADSSPTASTLRSIDLSVDTRFPEPTDPLSAHVEINASGPTGITWYVNGTAMDCNTANCTLDVSYPANLTVSVSNAETSLHESTTVRASDIELSATTLNQRKPVILNESDSVLINVTTQRHAIQHELLSSNWTVDNAVGTRTGAGNSSTTQLAVQQDGRIESTLTYQLRDPETNQTTTITKTTHVNVERLHTKTDHYTFAGLDNLYDTYGFASAQDQFSNYHDRLSQRITPLPETIDISIATDDDLAEAGCPNAGACAIEPNKILLSNSLSRPWTPQSSGRTLKHELVHIAQYELNAETANEWDVLAEGHAEFDSGPTPRHLVTLAEKPPLTELTRNLETTQDYTNGSVFVSAFYAEYGRQAFLELIEGSESEALAVEFESVTGDTLASFHDQWQPTDPAAGPNSLRTAPAESAIEVRPMFVYQNGTLTALHPPADVRVAWDVDGDGTVERTGATVSWSPAEPGTHPVTLRYSTDSRSLSQTQRLTVETVSRTPLDVTGDGNPATDPDADGAYEDVNGDGQFGILDVQALFGNLDSDVVAANASRFDYNDDGHVGILDVQTLFAMSM